MTPRERLAYLRMQRRAASLSPELRRELFRAWDAIRASLTPSQLETLIVSGRLDAIVDEALLDRSFAPLRERILSGVQQGFAATARVDLPTQASVSFDTLNPLIVDAVRRLDDRALNTLADDIRDVVRAHVENGLRDGKTASAIAKELRQAIGLSATQDQYVQNLRRELLDGNISDAARRKLLDRRFNLEKLASLPEAERLKRIDTITESYRKRFIAHNAETNTRNIAVNSQRLGQRLSWEDAVASGAVGRDSLFRRWVTVQDDRVRDEHQAMHGEEVPFDSHFSNGELTPGESTYGCRCVEIYVVRRPALRAAA